MERRNWVVWLCLREHNPYIATPRPGRMPNSQESATDSRLGRILRLLCDNATVVVSGTRIAEELGTSRSEVWRAVQQLREFGVQITGHPATGYQLASMPDLLLPEILRPLVKGTIFGERIHHYFRIGSTNTTAMDMAVVGVPEGSVYVAEQQTAGRGRGAHTWDSAQSAGIYCSIVLRPKLAPGDALMLSLVAGLAVREAVQRVTGLHPDLRWPNDVLLGEKKFCDILTEMNAEATRVRHVVVGIGLNVNQTSFPAELEAIATSLRIESGREWSRVELTAALLQSLDSAYHELALGTADVRAGMIRRFEQHSSYVRSRYVAVEEEGGYEGVTEGLDPRGFLQVRTATGLRTVLSGTVRAANGK